MWIMPVPITAVVNTNAPATRLVQLFFKMKNSSDKLVKMKQQNKERALTTISRSAESPILYASVPKKSIIQMDIDKEKQLPQNKKERYPFVDFICWKISMNVKAAMPVSIRATIIKIGLNENMISFIRCVQLHASKKKFSPPYLSVIASHEKNTSFFQPYHNMTEF